MARPPLPLPTEACEELKVAMLLSEFISVIYRTTVDGLCISYSFDFVLSSIWKIEYSKGRVRDNLHMHCVLAQLLFSNILNISLTS